MSAVTKNVFKKINKNKAQKYDQQNVPIKQQSELI